MLDAYFNKFDLQKVICLIIIDYFILNSVWDESFDRRTYNHIHNNDIDYNRKDWLKFIPNLLSKKIIFELKKFANHPKMNSLQTTNKLLAMAVGGYYTTKPPLYLSDFTNEEKNRLKEIGNMILPRLQKYVKHELELHDGNLSIFINRYSGTDSEFEWHYDRDSPHFYKVVILLDGIGNYSTFEYYDSEKNKNILLPLNEGDGVLFNGLQTHHRIPPSNDPNSSRTTLLFQFKKKGVIIDEKKSFCNQLSHKSKFYIILFFLKCVLIGNLLLIGLQKNIPNIQFYLKDEIHILYATILLLIFLIYIFKICSFRTLLVYYIFTKIYVLNHYESLFYLCYMILSNKKNKFTPN